MADLRFIAQAPAVAQVDTFTPANVDIGDIFTITLTNDAGYSYEITFTATAGTVQNVVTGLVAAAVVAKALGYKPWDAVTATDTATEVTVTADIAGEPFGQSTTATTGGGTDDQTLTRAAVTANSGPFDWNSTENWDGGAVPGGAANQDVYVEGATIKYGLDQSGIGNTLDSLTIRRSQVGVNGGTGLPPAYLQMKATTYDLSSHHGPGTASESAPMNINALAIASTFNIHNSGTNSVSTAAATRIIGSAITTINIYKGKVGIAAESGETATVNTINIYYVSQKTSDADVTIGAGVTLTTLNKYGGTAEVGCAATTVNNYAGNLETHGTGAITTIKNENGTFTSNSSGTITNLNILGGTLDFTKSSVARTVTTPKLDPPGSIMYDPSIVTLTAKIQPVTTTGNVKYSASAA